MWLKFCYNSKGNKYSHQRGGKKAINTVNPHQNICIIKTDQRKPFHASYVNLSTPVSMDWCVEPWSFLVVEEQHSMVLRSYS